jgi:hypothetical protein
MKHLIARTEVGLTSSVSITHCGRRHTEMKDGESFVFEAALSDCEACLVARTEARNKARRPAPTSPLPVIHLDAGGQSRGQRALALLKILYRLRSMGLTDVIMSDEASYAWGDVKTLLAEEVPATITTKEK